MCRYARCRSGWATVIRRPRSSVRTTCRIPVKRQSSTTPSATDGRSASRYALAWKTAPDAHHPCIRSMTSQGRPLSRLRRALENGNLLMVRAAAAEMGGRVNLKTRSRSRFSSTLRTRIGTSARSPAGSVASRWSVREPASTNWERHSTPSTRFQTPPHARLSKTSLYGPLAGRRALRVRALPVQDLQGQADA